jgi:hypothetical protein
MKIRGFLPSSKINSISNAVVIFLLLSLPVYATDWYVNKNASGNNNGTSWTNAWQSFSAISWNSIQPGDYIYISGGTDSTVYTSGMTVGKNGTSGHPITITIGKYAPVSTGHSGRVIFDGGGGSMTAFQIRATGVGRKYITIKGFECRNLEQGVNIEDVASNIVVDSLNIYNYSGQGAIMINGASEYSIDSTTIKNCRIVSVQLAASQSDGVYAQRCQRTLFYNNYIRQRNQDPNAHTDCLQAYLTNGWVIYNNFFINDSVYSPEGGGTPMILGSQGTNPVIIYNNFLYMGGIWDPSGSQNSALWTRWYSSGSMPPTWVIHNTIVVNGPRCRAFIQEYDAVSINNILAVFSTSGGMANLEESLPHAIPVDNTRHNLFWRSGGGASFSGQFTGNGHTGSVSGWSSWTGTYGGTGVNADPLFVHKFGYEPDQGALDGELKAGSSAINQGEDAQALINELNATYNLEGEWALQWKDRNGITRDNTPDMGAYQYYNEEDTTFSLLTDLADGYNLLSVPGINPEGMAVNVWWSYRDMSASVFKYSNGYQRVTTTIPGEGYWMKQSGRRTYNTGDEWPATGILKVVHVPLNVSEGWNLIGGYETSVFSSNLSTNPPGLLVGPIYKYSSGFHPSTIINPGSGYWIKMLGAGQIIIPDSFMKEKDENDLFPDDWGRIIITDANDVSYTLYAVTGEVDLGQYELPPAPMEGMYDFRFSSGTIAENLENDGQTIEMNGACFPVRVKVENMNITVQDENGNELNATIKNGEEIAIINNSINRLKIVSSKILGPNNYSLEQNYPNPFNPKTIIKFSLPEETYVTLIIYNLLGEKIIELVNEKLEVGNYSYTWNAEDSASGIYIYEIKTNKYTSSKKMVLLR